MASVRCCSWLHIKRVFKYKPVTGGAKNSDTAKKSDTAELLRESRRRMIGFLVERQRL
jgi:hypothetical protein